MQSVADRNEKHIGVPFYIFITLLIGGVATASAVVTWRAGNPVPALLSSLIFALHIGFYWLNLKQFQGRHWWIFYYAAQSVLIIVLAQFPYGVDIGPAIAATLTITQVGEALGLWGNTRRAFWLGLFYFGLLSLLIVQMVAPDQLLGSLSGILINGGFIVLVMVVYNQRLAEQRKAMELAETLESANAQLAAYAAKNAALTLQTERQRMARELHDTLAQGVAGLSSAIGSGQSAPGSRTQRTRGRHSRAGIGPCPQYAGGFPECHQRSTRDRQHARRRRT